MAKTLNYWYAAENDTMAIWEGQVFLLDRDTPKPRAIKESFYNRNKLLVDELMKFEGIYRAWSSSDLLSMGTGDDLTTWVRNGFMPQRSGDILFVMRPGHFELEEWSNGHGTTHGSPWTYDTHVPILFYGAGVRHTEVLRRTHITDIVPTISAIVGMSLTDACTGRVVDEVVK